MTYILTWHKALKLQQLLKERQKRVAASVTLAGEVLEGVNLIVPAQQRSRFVERAVRRELVRRLRQARAEHDMEILNAKAEQLDRETEDLVDHQADPFS
jgi:metal-responsive CopG/Arc/MetJ family transcriptional regulator